MKSSIHSGLRAVDFFCGGGGMSSGLMRSGIEVVAALDNDAQCQETYTANHPHVNFLLEDVTELSEKKFSNQTGIQKNDDRMIFIGCSPCQFWSVITGKSEVRSERKKTSSQSRNLLHDFLRFVKYYKPGFVIIENVRGIERNQRESGLLNLLKFLERNNYSVDSSILSCADFGVPQTRRRFILVASRVVSKIHLPEASGRRKSPTVRSAIGKLSKIKAGESDKGDALHRSPSLSDTNIARLQVTPEGGLRSGWMNKSKLMIEAYRDKPLAFFRENYGRMSWDAPAPTITTKFYALGSGRFGHPEQNRALSLREGALLQTFPKSYKFKTNGFHPTARIIGNAVPPKLACELGKSIIKQAKKAGII